MTLPKNKLSFSDKRVLMLGLGLLGGGVATANWLLSQGVKLTIVDKKTKEDLAESMLKIKGHAQYFLGGREPGLDGIDTIVLNPGVSYKNALVQKARSLNIPIINEATIFYDNFKGKIIGITGTRGKTTTAHWTAHLIGSMAVLCGNSPEHPFMQIMENEELMAKPWAVTELSSFHLELFDETVRSPDIAVLTNIYKDHLNRYDSFEEYAETKKKLYRFQKEGQILINHKEDVPIEPGSFVQQWGTHNLANLRLASLTAHHAGISWDDIRSRIATLPQIPFRQETIFENENVKIINDGNATSPDAVIAALKRFGSPTTILITGGTDKNMDFTELTSILPQYIKTENLVLLSGSATKKLLVGLPHIIPLETLSECVFEAFKRAKKYPHATIVFSPGGSSFEKFKNEYDRSNQFNKLVKNMLKK